jgi:HipA-like protein
MFTSKFHKGPPPTIQILYQGTLVAELSKNKQDCSPVYTFRYLPAFRGLNLAPLPGLPYSEHPQQSGSLWPFFAERIPDARRPEIRAWMKLKKLSEYDDIRLLSELGSHSITDPFEIRLAA